MHSYPEPTRTISVTTFHCSHLIARGRYLRDLLVFSSKNLMPRLDIDELCRLLAQEIEILNQRVNSMELKYN
jgi:hypothetical protein